MELHSLKPAKGSTKNSKRVGRGQGSGKGGTATRGHKGAQSRSGYSRKIGFEGGQQPLQRRVPKFGFRNPNRVEYRVINLDTLSEFAEKNKWKEVTIENLISSGLASKKDKVKILGDGELAKALNISAHKFSKKAQELIEKAGGKVTVIS
ncbi:50S ribosomal protein L15 [Hyphobacterium sp. CCMP332]|nr:50S ribosomal protein L15 [Hyphobacterium sp. CCMP332]